MDKLSDEMSDEAKENPGLDVIGTNPNAEEPEQGEETVENPIDGIIGGTPEKQEAKPNNLADLAEESELDMFNQPVEDETEPDYEDEDNEDLKDSPLRLPV